MILSTKKLTSSQKQLLNKSRLEFFDYNAIEITLCDFRAPQKIKNAIFTSQNAVRAFFSDHNMNRSRILKAYCVGEKTKTLLVKNDQNVVKMCPNASELAIFLSKMKENTSFYFFCGNRRRDEILKILKESKMNVFDVKTYNNQLKARKFEQNWTKILFFSPSGVESFVANNKLGDSLIICIGDTTASEVKKHTNNIVIANSSTVESVIQEAVKTIETL